jgi:hypothetical protein
MEHVLRQCLIALRLSERLGLEQVDREAVYYTSLLAWVGCYVNAYFGELIARCMLADASFVNVVLHEAPGDPRSGIFVSAKPRT